MSWRILKKEDLGVRPFDDKLEIGGRELRKDNTTLKEFLKKLNGKIFFLINVCIVYTLIYCTAYQVPLQSDDYDYFLLGLSLDAHIKHYIDWSGRFIADYTSAILLNCFKKPVYMAINSFVLLSVIIIIAILPNIVRKREMITQGLSAILWLVFILYWISNPNLGQTSFWLVGSANYLWPLMWAGIYFAFLLFLLANDSKIKARQYIILFLLGIFAGFSNEALGLMVVLFTACMFFVYRKNKVNCVITGLFSSVIGYSFMFLAPGNYMRLNIDGFEYWRALSLSDKVLDYVFHRMPSALDNFYITYLIFILLLIVVVWVQNDKTNNKSCQTVSLCAFSFICCVLSVCSICVFAISPIIPPRTENTCLFFLLLAFSFIANILIDIGKRKGILFYVLVSICGAYFVFSYSFVLYAYTQTRTQADIREYIIKEAKTSGRDSADIPGWYFTHLVKDADKFDKHKSAAMSDYYGLERIDERKDINFNYAVIRNTPPIVVNKRLKDTLILDNIYIKMNPPYEQTIVFEFENPLVEFAQGGEVFYIQLNVDGKKEPIRADLDLNDFIQIGDKYYYGNDFIQIEDEYYKGESVPAPSIRIDKLSSVDYGFYDSYKNVKSTSYSLAFDHQ